MTYKTFMTTQQKLQFEIWLLKNNMSLRGFAKKSGVSVQYLSQIINGKNAITDGVIRLFEKNGYKIG